MPAATPSFEEQAASLHTISFKDGDSSDGSPTAEETAAAAADAAHTAAAAKAAKEPAQVDDDDAEDTDDADESAEAKAAAAAAKPEAEGAAEKPKGKPTAKERIADVTAKYRGAARTAESERARADRAESELRELRAGKTPLTPPAAADTGADAPPDPSKFDYGELDAKYIAALSRHETRQALKEERAADEKIRQTAAAAEAQKEQTTKQDAMVKAGVQLHDDFDEVVMQGARDGKWELSRDLGVLLLDSEFGAQIAYDLAKDPEEALRVSKLSPAKQAAFLGRQEAKFEAAEASQGAAIVPKTPQAQPPPRLPKGGSGSLKVGADSSDFAAVEQAWKAGGLRQ